MAAKKKRGGKEDDPRDQKGHKDQKGAQPPKADAELIDQKMLYGLSHSLRVRLLALLCDEPSSPRRLSDTLDENLSRVAYHIKILLETDLIALVETRPVRGALEHIYAPVHPLILPEGLWSALPKSARQKIYADVLADIDNDVTASIVADLFDARSDFHVSLTPMCLDEIGCRKLAKSADGLLEEMVEIQKESSARLGKDKDAERFAISAAMLIFQSARETGKQASERKKG